jgi:hypothetical protein
MLAQLVPHMRLTEVGVSSYTQKDRALYCCKDLNICRGSHAGEASATLACADGVRHGALAVASGLHSSAQQQASVLWEASLLVL